MAPLLKEWALQYPGLMNNFAASGAGPAAQGLVDIGWITWLGAESCAAVRSSKIAEELAELRPQGVAVDVLPDGTMRIVSAPAPDVSVATTDVANRYRIGEALRPLWNEAANRQQVVPGFANDPEGVARGRWTNRFFLPRE